MDPIDPSSHNISGRSVAFRESHAPGGKLWPRTRPTQNIFGTALARRTRWWCELQWWWWNKRFLCPVCRGGDFWVKSRGGDFRTKNKWGCFSENRKGVRSGDWTFQRGCTPWAPLHSSAVNVQLNRPQVGSFLSLQIIVSSWNGCCLRSFI